MPHWKQKALAWMIFGAAMNRHNHVRYLSEITQHEETVRDSMLAQSEAEKTDFHRQSKEAHRLREFGYSIAEGKHHGHFERKD